MAVNGFKGFEFEAPAAYFTSVTTTVPPVADAATTHSGVASMKCPPGAYGTDTFAAGVRGRSRSFYFMIDSTPTGASAIIFSARNPNANMTIFVATSGVIFAQVQGGATINGGTPTLNAWHRIDVSVDSSAATYTMKWQVDGVAKTDATFAPVGGAADMSALWLGQTNGASTTTAWIDDVIDGSSTADYPLGGYHVLPYAPNGVGTHVTPGDFTLTGTTLSGADTTSWMAIDEAPPSSVDYVEQATALSTAYLEYTLADSVEASAPSYVSAIAAVTSNSTGTNNVIVKIRDGSSDGTVYSGSTGGTTTQYQSAFFATKPSTGAWTLATFNALLLRFGFSTDVIPPPRLQAFIVEAAYPDSVFVTKTSSDSAVFSEASSVTTSGTGNVPITGTDTAAISREIATVSKFGQTQNSFQQSGLWGAGFQNVIAPSPLVPGVVLVGGDVSGVHRSTDYGDTWVTQNQEITVFSDRAIADIKWHPTQKDRVFRVSGNGTQGSFWESLDQGLTWAKRSTIPAAAGTSHTGLTDTGEHPRSIGHLIVVDTVNSFVYVGTYNDGIYRATLGAASGIGTFTRIALGPNATGGAYYIRALVADSNDPDTLYASTYLNAAATEGTTLSGRVWRIENASTASPLAVQFTNSPLCTEDMVHLGTTLYCVAYESATGDRGLWSLDAASTAAAATTRAGAFANWWNRTNAVPYTTEVWYSIDGVLSGQNLTLYCGCTSAVNNGAGAYQCLFKATSANAGLTMTSAAIHPDTFSSTGTSGSVRKLVGGISGERDWWMFAKQPTSMFGGGPGYAAASIAIDKSAATTTGTGGGAKNPIQGIIDPNVSTIPSGYAGTINALTVYLDWVDLQPTSTSLLNGTDVTQLDNMLTYAAANNIYIKVRLFTGAKHSASGTTGAPAWLVAQTGTFLSKNAQDAGAATAIAKFWTPAFKTAYDNLMQLMAARWDANARLLDITISGAMTRYAEPFIRDLGTPQNRAELVGGGVGWGGTFIAAGAPGYTDALNQAAHLSFIDSHAARWTTTNSSLSFNPYQRLDSYSSFTTNDATIRRSILAYFKDTLGARGVIENNSIRPDYFTYDASGTPTGFSNTVPSYTAMYQDHVTYGPPSFYQTANNTQITNATYTTVQTAMQATQAAADQILGANAVEPSSGVGSFTAATVGTWNTALKNNPLPVSGGGTGGTTQYPNKTRVFIAGRSGAWRTQNADAATASVLFYPDVRNLGVTVNRPLLCDPGDPDKVYSGSTDWTFIYSTDAMGNVDMNDTGITASVGLCIAVDETTNPSTVYLGVGTRDTNTLGGVFSNTNPTAGTTWASTSLETAAGGAQPIGLTFMRNASNQAILIAAVTGQIPGDTSNSASAGLYRKVGTGAWAKIANTNVTPSGVVMVGEASRAAVMTSRRGSPNVYLMDGASGVWRSTDYGASWTRILIHTASNADYVGYVSAHPTDTNTIYLSLSTGIFQVNNAATAAQDAATLTDISGGTVQNPGAMKVTNDSIYCVSRVTPKLWRSSLTSPSVWASIDDQVFRDTSIFAQDIDIDTTGRAYIATNGNGIIRQVTTAYSDSDSAVFSDTATVSTGSASPSVTDTITVTDTASVATVSGPATGTGTKKKWPKRS